MNDFDTAITIVKRLLQYRKTAGVSMLDTPQDHKEKEALRIVLELLKDEKLSIKNKLEQTNN